ncbi:MAG: hypothetical protein KAS72_06080 [Phycisphaerales bacterium]|nr:hypothetical protein [Phycisphaerales bacterium]
MLGTFSKVAVGLATAAVLAIGSQASAIHDFVYDTTAGASSHYTGDLTAGTLTLEDIDGRNFRVQRQGTSQVALGFFGAGVGPASMVASVDLTNWIDSGDPNGYGDVAVFAGAMSGTDFLAVDEFGNTFSGNIPVFELTDRSDALRPGIEGQGFITDIAFSAPTFQGVTTSDLYDYGSIFTFTFSITGVNLETYLATSGLGGQLIEVETIEARVYGIPLPATTGLAFAGLVPFGVLTLRRRR